MNKTRTREKKMFRRRFEKSGPNFESTSWKLDTVGFNVLHAKLQKQDRAC